MKKYTILFSIILLAGCSSSSNFIDYRFNEPVAEHEEHVESGTLIEKVAETPLVINSAGQKVTQLDHEDRLLDSFRYDRWLNSLTYDPVFPDDFEINSQGMGENPRLRPFLIPSFGSFSEQFIYPMADGNVLLVYNLIPYKIPNYHHSYLKTIPSIWDRIGDFVHSIQQWSRVSPSYGVSDLSRGKGRGLRKGHLYVASGNTIYGFDPMEGEIKKDRQTLTVGRISDHFGIFDRFSNTDHPYRHVNYPSHQRLYVSQTDQDYTINSYFTISPDGSKLAAIRGMRYLDVYIIDTETLESDHFVYFADKQLKADSKGIHSMYDISASFFDGANNFYLLDKTNNKAAVFNPEVNSFRAVREIDDIFGNNRSLIRDLKYQANNEKLSFINSEIGISTKKLYSIEYYQISEQQEAAPAIGVDFIDRKTKEKFYSTKFDLQNLGANAEEFADFEIYHNPYEKIIYLWNNSPGNSFGKMIEFDYSEVLGLKFPSERKWMEENGYLDLYQKVERGDMSLSDKAVKANYDKTFYYKGPTNNGLAEGVGNAVTKDGNWAIINGEFEEGKLVKGSLFCTCGEIYAGEFEGGIFTEKGTTGHTETAAEIPSLSGFGMRTDSDENIYRGFFEDGKLNGEGEVNFVSGAKHVGEFQEGKLNGKGKIVRADETTLVGSFSDGRPIGQISLMMGEETQQAEFDSRGKRIDEQYVSAQKELKEKQQSIISELKKIYEQVYEARIAKQEQRTKLVNSALFGAAMGGAASSMGMDDLTAFEFGVAAFTDSYQGTTNNLSNFSPSVQNAGDINSGEGGFFGNYKRLAAFTENVNKVGMEVADAFDLDGLKQTLGSVSSATNYAAQTQPKSNQQQPAFNNPMGGQNQGGSGDKDALVGTWSSSSGSVEFNGDGSGQMMLKNLNSNAPCPEGSITKFNWSVSNERLSLEYTSMSICGESQPTPEPDAPKSYSIQGNTLSWAGVSWDRN